MTNWIKAGAVRDLLPPGASVFVQGAASEPTHLLDALAGGAPRDLRYLSVQLSGINRRDLAALHEGARFTGFFVTPETRNSFADGDARFLPLGYPEIVRYLAGPAPLDAALIQVAPPDGDGRCSLGISADFPTLALSRAPVVIAEVNGTMPSPPGSPWIAMERIDYAVETDHPLVELAPPADDEASSAIAAALAGLIEDGDTLQMGIGRIPTAFLSALAGHRDLGIHSGLISDPVADLVRQGVVTGAGKTMDPGKVVTGVALGTKPLYDFLAHAPDIEFRPAAYTHDPSVIARIERFTAVNSGIEVDLLGQVNGETVGGRQVSGAGGLATFMAGARLARGGRAVMALPATADGGARSRIVPLLQPGSAVTVPRAHADMVLTEHGLARLRHLDLDARAEALIAIAAPQFQGDLAAAWERFRADGSPAPV